MKKKILAVSALLLPLALSGCGKVSYEKLTKDMRDETIYTSSTNILASADVNIHFDNLSESAQADMENAMEEYGIDIHQIDGHLDMLMQNSMVSDDYMTYYNNFGTNNFTSSSPEIEAVIKDYLGSEVSNSEIYADRKSGEVAVSVDEGEWVSLGKESGVDTTLLTTKDILLFLDVLDQITDKKTVETANTDIGYDLTYHIDINAETMEKIPEEVRQKLCFNDISYEQILNIVRKLDAPAAEGEQPKYSCPATIVISFLKQEKEYKIQGVDVSAEMNVNFNKSFEDLGLNELVDGGLLPEDYRFDVGGDVKLILNYQNTFGYLPTKVME